MNTIPHDLVGCNVHETDRFKLDYELTKSEQVYAIFCTYTLTFGGLLLLFHWMLQIATR